MTITSMPKKSESLWPAGLAINLTSNLIATIVAGAVTYFSHEGSTWVKPLLFGGMAWIVTFISILAFRFMRRIPPRVETVTPDNIGGKIRDWLDEFNLTVQSLSDPNFYFSFLVTTESGRKIAIFRSKNKFSDYVEFGSHLTQTEADKRQLSELSEDEKLATRLAMILELTRAVMGYKWDDAFENLQIFKRIPITSALTEADIFREMYAVEAMIGSIYAVFQMGVHKHKVRDETKSANKSIIAGELPHSG